MSSKTNSLERLRLRSKELRQLPDKELHLESILLGQETLRRRDPLKSLEFKVKTNGPVTFFGLGDMHIGSKSTDYEALYDLQDKILNTNNAFVYLLGDEIEGQTPKYLSTIMDRSVSLEDQIKHFQEFIRPLYEKGKIICMVGEYFGHPGWAKDSSGMDPWKRMLGDMDIPIVQNNAEIIVVFQNGKKHIHRVMHDPGRGGRIDELHGVRIVANREESDVAMRAHLHSAGIGVENTGRGGKPRVLVGVGAFKGTNEGLPGDALGIRKAMADPAPGGQTVVAMPSTSRKERMAQPFMSADEGLFAHSALELLNETEAQGITKEVIEELHQKFPVDDMRINSRRSRRSGGEALLDKHRRSRARKQNGKKGAEEQQSPWFREPYEVPYNTLGLETKLSLPISVEPIANLRLGAATFRRKEFARYMSELSGDDRRFVVWMRNLLDKEAGKLPSRDEILDKLLSYMNQVGQDRNIALLLDGSLSTNDWKRQIAEWYETEDKNGKVKRERIVVSEPIPPATTLAHRSGMPLIENQGMIDLHVELDNGKEVKVPILVWDKLMNRGSTEKPTAGLVSLYKAGIGGRPRVSMGGHLQKSGWSSIYDATNPHTKNPVFIATGWLSEFDSMGKGNRMEGGEPGPSFILVPDQNDVMVVPVHSFEQRETLINAATLQVGLEKTGQRESVMSRRGRRRKSR